MAICFEDENASVLFSVNKSRYQLLGEIFNETNFANRNLTVFIDSAKAFEGFRQKYMEGAAEAVFTNKLTENMAAEFFNFIAHYRRFFKTLSVKTKFVLLHGYSDEYAANFFPEYNSALRESKYNRFLDFIVRKRIAPMAYTLPDIYVLDSNNIGEDFDRCQIPLILNDFEDADFLMDSRKLFITNDIQMMYNVALLKRAWVLRVSHKSANIISASRVFEFLSKDYKTPIEGIPAAYLPSYYALNGGNGVEPISKKLKKAMIFKGLKELGNRREDEVNNAEFLYTLFEEKMDGTALDIIHDLNVRLGMFKLQELRSSLSEATELALLSQLVSSPDFDEAAELNTRTFGDKIDLTALF